PGSLAPNFGDHGPSDSALAASSAWRLRRPGADRHAARCASRDLCSGGAPRRYSPSIGASSDRSENSRSQSYSYLEIDDLQPTPPLAIAITIPRSPRRPCKLAAVPAARKKISSSARSKARRAASVSLIG